MGEEEGGLILVGDTWFPAYDAKNADRLLPYIRRNLTDITLSAALCKKHDLCVQAGGHVGIWPIELAKTFTWVWTFEPQPMAFRAMTRNIPASANIVLSPRALWSSTADLWLGAGADSGTWYVDEHLAVDRRNGERSSKRASGVAIDAYNFVCCDAIYLDVEGAEAEVLKGAAETIRKFKPVLHLEILPRARVAIEAEIARIGYRFVRAVHKDSIFVPAS